MVVAIAVGRPGIDAMLVTSQVILSIVLPFIIFPLVVLTSSKTIMRVRRPTSTDGVAVGGGALSRPLSIASESRLENNIAADEFVDFSNSWLTIAIAAAIWLVIVLANFYVIISLILGKSG